MTTNVVFRETDPKQFKMETASTLSWIVRDGTLYLVLGNDGQGGVNAIIFDGAPPQQVNIDADDMVSAAAVKIQWSRE